MTALPLCSISVDVDTLRFYHDIHGLPSPSPHQADAIYTHAMPRILRMFRNLGIRGTFFIIGEDAHVPAHQEILHQIIEEGHEIANHTYHHPYRLTALSPAQMEEEIAQAEEILQPFLKEGQRIVGFRSPGYNTTPELLQILRDRGYLYDSSVFPSSPYYLAKASVMGIMQLLGRPSRALLGSPKVLRAPYHPYKPAGNPYVPAKSPKEDDLWQLPIAVVPGLQLPLIGTYLILYPELLLKAMLQWALKIYPFFNLELHAIDFFDAYNDPGASALIPHQHDLRVSLTRKLARMEDSFTQIQKSHICLPLAEVLSSMPQLAPPPKS
ncbi:MAG: polysaccharide deacetylase family protein [Myxococcales bacterium]|nr:polysaccharide deacetylase family protein [Myxococcales bacterium]MCB9641889.1 polysaccharide deacetylase family protein [Myxococcales bacterium]